ncbi:Panacea domain-containing protein [Paenisporosarcina macmurdoensis]|uniref:Panacea domain-containing protein n=1 Tax=Paenisporosarcina macmurdoensis TaxID=212659 RepID=A0ABW1L4A5_9BACL
MIHTLPKKAVTTVNVVADTFLSIESMTHKKLQKLCYYAYSWYYTYYEEKLFNNKFEAWVHGPVVPELYREFKDYGWRDIEMRNVPVEVMQHPLMHEFIHNVYNSYGHLNGNELEYLTHIEEPWKEARGHLGNLDACSNEINDSTIMSYYRKVLEDEQQD